METLLRYELDSFSVGFKSFAPHYRCSWGERVPGRLCVFLDGTMLEEGARVATTTDVVYKPPEDRPALRFGEGGARTLTIELHSTGVEMLRSGGFDVEEPFQLRSSPCYWQAERMRREMTDGDAMTPLVMEGLVLDLFTRSHRGRAKGAPPAWLTRVHQRIEAEFVRPLTLRDYARDAGVHPVRLAESYRRFYRSSVGEHIRGLRLRRAMDALRRTPSSIAEIALESGFSDQSHLTRAFKRHTGLTPKQFRDR